MNRTFALLLAGCGTSYTVSDYTPPDGQELVDVKFVARDDYANSDYISVSIYSRPSCEQPPHLETIVELETRPIWEEDIREGQAQLPANRRLDLRVFHGSSSGYVTTRCVHLQGHELRSRQSYLLEVQNWSTPGSSHGGFGCAFAVYELDQNGNRGNELTRFPPSAPECD